MGIKVSQQDIKRIFEQPSRVNDHQTYLPILESLELDQVKNLKVILWGEKKPIKFFLRYSNLSALVCYEYDSSEYGLAKNKYTSLVSPGVSFELNLQEIDSTGLKRSDGTYNPKISYVTHAKERYAENTFDVAFVGEGLYGTDSAEMAQYLVKDGGVIVWDNILSFKDNPIDLPSGRLPQEVFQRFSEYYYFDLHKGLMIVNRKSGVPYQGMPGLPEKYNRLERTFSNLDENGIEFLLLRSNDVIPVMDSTRDLDVLIHPNSLRAAIEIFQHLGYVYQKDSTDHAEFLYQAEPHHHFYDRQLKIHIDVVNGLYYSSLNNNEQVAVHRDLQNSIFQRKMKTCEVWRYNAHPNDLFLHILCRTVYDKKEMQPKYVDLLNVLYAHIDENLLKVELESLFFKFGPRIISLIQNNKTEAIYHEYLSFTEY